VATCVCIPNSLRTRPGNNNNNNNIPTNGGVRHFAPRLLLLRSEWKLLGMQTQATASHKSMRKRC
jgi:hypothetical protein